MSPDYEAGVAAHFDKDREVPLGTRGKTLQLVRAAVDAAIGELQLVSPTALVIERDENGEWNEDLAYMLGSSKCDRRSRQYAPDKIANGRKILDALASSQREGE